MILTKTFSEIKQRNFVKMEDMPSKSKIINKKCLFSELIENSNHIYN